MTNDIRPPAIPATVRVVPVTDALRAAIPGLMLQPHATYAAVQFVGDRVAGVFRAQTHVGAEPTLPYFEATVRALCAAFGAFYDGRGESPDTCSWCGLADCSDWERHDRLDRGSETTWRRAAA